MTQIHSLTLWLKLIPPGNCSSNSKCSLWMRPFLPFPSSFPRWHVALGQALLLSWQWAKGWPVHMESFWAGLCHRGLVWCLDMQGVSGLLSPLSQMAYPAIDHDPTVASYHQGPCSCQPPLNPRLQELQLSTHFQLFNIFSPECMGTAGSLHFMHRPWGPTWQTAPPTSAP